MAQLRGRYAGPLEPAEQWQYAKDLAGGRTVMPTDYRANPGDLVALMAHAIALDIPLPVAWTHLHFNADGKGGMSGILMYGLLIIAGHRVNILRADDHEVCAQLVRGDGLPGGQARWSIREAMRADLLLTTRWRRYPGDMLWWRCLARLARRFAPDVVLGLGYLPEELETGAVGEEDPTEPAEPTDAVDADGNPVPRADVMAFLADVDTLSWADIRRKMKKAVDLGLHGLYAGTVDSVPLTVQDTLINAGNRAVAAEEAQREADTPPGDGLPPTVGVPNTPVVDLGRTITGMACPCPLEHVVSTGNHLPECGQYRPPFAPKGGEQR